METLHLSGAGARTIRGSRTIWMRRREKRVIRSSLSAWRELRPIHPVKGKMEDWLMTVGAASDFLNHHTTTRSRDWLMPSSHAS